MTQLTENMNGLDAKNSQKAEENSFCKMQTIRHFDILLSEYKFTDNFAII
jgi:hypothetical protein